MEKLIFQSSHFLFSVPIKIWKIWMVSEKKIKAAFYKKSLVSLHSSIILVMSSWAPISFKNQQNENLINPYWARKCSVFQNKLLWEKYFWRVYERILMLQKRHHCICIIITIQKALKNFLVLVDWISLIKIYRMVQKSHNS